MGEILNTAEALLNGEKTVYKQHPFGPPWGPEKIDDTTWFVKGFANTIVRETREGLIVIDPAGSMEGGRKHKAVRSVSQSPLHTAIYTHGHLDHVFGVERFLNEAGHNGGVLPRVIAHEAILDRFIRYRTTNGWNQAINSRQFLGGARTEFPSEFYLPDTIYRDQLDITVGGINARLKHARGETDDGTWVFFPDNKILATGDLMIWAIPNAGNPQKVQRYAGEWAAALRKMQALNPEILLPGHGFPIMGRDRVQQVLSDTAEYLESILDQVLKWMNRGEALDRVIQQVKAPEKLTKRAYLQPIYDECEFLVHNIWRQYGGWYDGTPSHLKPSSQAEQSMEIARLAGGADRLIARALELADAGDFRLACHLAEWAAQADSENAELRQAAADIFNQRAATETSTMAVGIFKDMARRLSGSNGEETSTDSVIGSQMKRD